MTKKLLWLPVLGLFLINVSAGCVPVPVVVKAPRVKWVPITIKTVGNGAPPANAVNPAQARLLAERAAKLDAYRNLLEQAYGVRISTDTSVRDFITQNDSIRTRVDGYVQGARVTETRYEPDGAVQVSMEIVLLEDFRNLFPQPAAQP